MTPERMREWARHKEHIDLLRRRKSRWAHLGWALVGVGTAAILSWLPYLAADTSGSWVAVLTIVVGSASLGVGVIALLAAKQTQKSIDDAVYEAKLHMYDMESILSEEQRKQIATMAGAVLDL